MNEEEWCEMEDRIKDEKAQGESVCSTEIKEPLKRAFLQGYVVGFSGTETVNPYAYLAPEYWKWEFGWAEGKQHAKDHSK